MTLNKLRNVTILGSTGSIGVSTLDVIARHPDKFRVAALTAHSRVDILFQQCVKFRPDYAVIGDAENAGILAARLKNAGIATQVKHGAPAIEEVASLPQVDMVMAAIVGIAGLPATHAAVCAGKIVMLANKEALVTAGPVFMKAVHEHGATLLPIDSEHNAVFQALPERYAGDMQVSGVRRIVLTASGGPFRDTPIEQLKKVTPAQACAHPNWVMGRKISVDSATMMNKGLEIIEASFLFNAPESQIDVVIHPESVIHSLVEYLDGSMLAQLGNPDMRTPIAYALGYPERIAAGVEFLDLTRVARLHFHAPDNARFPCLNLARQALRTGGSAPCVLNAANEVAVAAFLEEKLAFLQIPALIKHVLETVPAFALSSLDDVLRADSTARAVATAWLSAQAKQVETVAH